MPKPTQTKPLGDKDVMVGYQEWRGRDQCVLRYLYEDVETREMRPGKNGINIPEDDVLDAIQLLLDAYNEHTGTALVIMDSGL